MVRCDVMWCDVMCCTFVDVTQCGVWHNRMWCDPKLWEVMRTGQIWCNVVRDAKCTRIFSFLTALNAAKCHMLRLQRKRGILCWFSPRSETRCYHVDWVSWDWEKREEKKEREESRSTESLWESQGCSNVWQYHMSVTQSAERRLTTSAVAVQPLLWLFYWFYSRSWGVAERSISAVWSVLRVQCWSDFTNWRLTCYLEDGDVRTLSSMHCYTRSVTHTPHMHAFSHTHPPLQNPTQGMLGTFRRRDQTSRDGTHPHTNTLVLTPPLPSPTLYNAHNTQHT